MNRSRLAGREAQQLFFTQGRINNVLVSNLGDATGGLQHFAAITKRLRVLALDDGPDWTRPSG